MIIDHGNKGTFFSRMDVEKLFDIGKLSGSSLEDVENFMKQVNCIPHYNSSINRGVPRFVAGDLPKTLPQSES